VSTLRKWCRFFAVSARSANVRRGRAVQPTHGTGDQEQKPTAAVYVAPVPAKVTAMSGPARPTDTESRQGFCEGVHNDTSGEEHVTPWGSTQQFTAVLLRRN
jgi:hypothetical protein